MKVSSHFKTKIFNMYTNETKQMIIIAKDKLLKSIIITRYVNRLFSSTAFEKRYTG